MTIKRINVIHNHPLLQNRVRWVRICTWLVIFFHLYICRMIYEVLSGTFVGELRARLIIGGYMIVAVVYGLVWAYGFARPLAGKKLQIARKHSDGDRLMQLHREVAEKGGTVGRYKLYVVGYTRRTLNAYAHQFMGRHIGLSSDLVEFVTDSSRRAAFIAHEAGHLEARDTLSRVFISVTAVGIYILGWALMLGLPFFGWQISLMGLAVVMYYRWPLNYIIAYISRQQEYAADLYAAILGYGEPLVEALRQIYEGGRADLLTTMMRQQFPKYRPPTVDLEPFQHPLSSHPKFANRAALIRKVINEDQGWIPDRWEWFLGVTIFLGVGVGAFWFKHHSLAVSSGYVLLLIWMNVLHGLLGMGVGPAEETLFQKGWYWTKVGIGALIGFAAIAALGAVPQFRLFVPALAVVWALTPVFWFSAESGWDILEPFSEALIVVQLIAAGLGIYLMLMN